MNILQREWYQIRPPNYTGIILDEYQTVAYYLNGNYHRLGGYAIETRSEHTSSYWIYGKCVSKEAHDLLCDLMKLKGLL